LAAIRTVDPRTLAFYEPNVIFNDGADTNVGPVGDRRAAMSFHDYCLTSDSGGPTLSCDQFDDLVFQHADAHAASSGDALLMTEFGATGDPTVLTAMTDRADRFMVGWQEWHYCGCDDPTTSGPGTKQAIVFDPSRPPTGANVDNAKLDLLARPHPRAVAGTPTSFGFDGTRKVFTLAYTTARAEGHGSFPAGAETEISVPARQYPGGYSVAVQGGRVVSAPGDPVLRVASC